MNGIQAPFEVFWSINSSCIKCAKSAYWSKHVSERAQVLVSGQLYLNCITSILITLKHENRIQDSLSKRPCFVWCDDNKLEPLFWAVKSALQSDKHKHLLHFKSQVMLIIFNSKFLINLIATFVAIFIKETNQRKKSYYWKYIYLKVITNDCPKITRK